VIEPVHKLTPARRRAITGGVMVGLFLGAMEATVVATAMPTVVASLGGLRIYSWVFSAYLLTATVTVPLWGKLSDLHGRKRFYLAAVGVFLLGSMLSGLSRSMEQLILFRTLQGIGAGGVLPLTLTIVGEIYPLEQRARMQGLFSGVWGVASIVGPLLGGLITEHISWRWVFFVNVPFGLVAATVITVAMQEPPWQGKRVSVDYGAAALVTAAFTALLLALSEGSETYTWTSRSTLGLFAMGMICLAGFFWLERRAEQHPNREPILPPSLLANRIFSASAATGFLGGMAMFGAIAFIPLFVQAVIGTSPTEAGSVLTPYVLSWVICSILGGRFLLKVGYRRTAGLGMVLLVVGFLGLAALEESSTRTRVVINMIPLGSGMGFMIAPLTIAVQNSVPRAMMGIATSALVFVRSIGGAVGVAIMGARLSTAVQRAVTGLNDSPALYGGFRAEALMNPMARASLPSSVLETLRGAIASGLHEAYLVGLLVAALGFACVFLIPGGRPQEQASSRTA